MTTNPSSHTKSTVVVWYKNEKPIKRTYLSSPTNDTTFEKWCETHSVSKKVIPLVYEVCDRCETTDAPLDEYEYCCLLCKNLVNAKQAEHLTFHQPNVLEVVEIHE